MPGHAVAGDPNAPGYAVVGDGMQGPEPAPIGVARAQQQPWAGAPVRSGRCTARRRAYDPSVMPTALPPAQVALAGPGSDRPHIISHLFGIPKFGRIRRDREDKDRQQHASITYDRSASQVNELPASWCTARTASEGGRRLGGGSGRAGYGPRLRWRNRGNWARARQGSTLERGPGRVARFFRRSQRGGWTGPSDFDEGPVFFYAHRTFRSRSRRLEADGQ